MKISLDYSFGDWECSFIDPAKKLRRMSEYFWLNVPKWLKKHKFLLITKFLKPFLWTRRMQFYQTGRKKIVACPNNFPSMYKSKKKTDSQKETKLLKKSSWTSRLQFRHTSVKCPYIIALCFKNDRIFFSKNVHILIKISIFPFKILNLKRTDFSAKRSILPKIIIWALEILFWLTCRIFSLNVPELFWLKSENDKKNFYQFFCSSQWSYGHVHNNSGILANFFPESPKNFP